MVQITNECLIYLFHKSTFIIFSLLLQITWHLMMMMNPPRISSRIILNEMILNVIYMLYYILVKTYEIEIDFRMLINYFLG
jgi:hypothetical protein